MQEGVSDEVDGLLRLFAAKVASDADVVDVDLSSAALVMDKAGTEHRLHLPRPVLAACLSEVRKGQHPWKAGLPAGEALARLMIVHLDESLATRSRHETGWWSYDGGFFEPLPPWEVPHHG